MMSNRKTIFITSFFGLIARNILDTKVLDILSEQPDLNMVVLTPKQKEQDYRKRFQKKNILIEGVELKPNSKLENFLFSLFLSISDTNSRRICRRADVKKTTDWARWIFWGMLSKFSNFKTVRSLLRYIDYLLLRENNKFSLYFDKYNPAFVFSTDVFESNDVDVMREARFRNIPIIGMVRSWDNITTHGLNRIIPEKLIVNTPSIKEESVKYNDIDPKNIFISGIPHYDDYIAKKRIAKEELFKRLNLDPNKKTIFFAPPPKIFVDENPVNKLIIDALMDLEETQLILRLYFVGEVEIGKKIEPIPNKLAIDSPPTGADSISGGLSFNDYLPDLLCYSDVVVAFASTLAIDAAVFKKPVVFIGFDGKQNYPYSKSLRRFYDFDHQKSLLKTSGVKLAKSIDELVKYIKEYINNPNLDDEGRKMIIDERCWKLDGKSSERLADYLIGNLKN